MKQILISIVLCIVAITAFAQENSKPYIKGFEDTYYNKEYIYFDSLNKLWKNEIECFDFVHHVYASFKVDTNSNVINLQVTELPIYPLPQPMKAYIEKLVTSTNGKWIPQIKHNQKVVSDEMIYRFDFLKANHTMQERGDALGKIAEYYLDYGFHVDIVRRSDYMKRSKIFTILY